MDQEPVLSPQPDQSQQQPQPENLPPKKISKGLLIIIAVVLLIVAGGALGYWQYQKQSAIIDQNALVSARNNSNNSQPTATPVDSSTSTLPTDYVATPPVCKNSGPILASKSGMMQWVSPQILNSFTLFASSSPDSSYNSDSSTLVGHFIAGQYQGGDLFITSLTFNDPSPASWFYVIRQGNKYTALGKYSDALPGLSDIKPTAVLAEDKNFDLPDLDFPQTLHSQNPAADFVLATNLGFYKNGTQVFCADYYRKVFTDPTVGDVYTDAGTQPIGTGPYSYSPKFGFYVKAPSGMQVTYQLNVGFTGKDNVPLLTWSNGKKNTQEYSFQHIGGCGASQFLDAQDVKQSDLTQIGAAPSGQPIYGYKDSNADELKVMYDGIYVADGQAKPTFQQFLADNPVFFWQEPFGRFVQFKIMKYQTLAECGKPVIYLYPPKTVPVLVKINPRGGMTKSEPIYKDGWNVIADPQSNITNLADGKIYPYLFWEGRGGMYQTPTKGFVVAKGDVHQFLTDKLKQLGLNNKEAGDFMEFWEPKMRGSAYYFVTFMGNQIMDRLAPLTITPQPDTVIRVLMDFTPLDHPVAAQGFRIRTPERNGFTVVEWGGVIRSEQK